MDPEARGKTALTASCRSGHGAGVNHRRPADSPTDPPQPTLKKEICGTNQLKRLNRYRHLYMLEPIIAQAIAWGTQPVAIYRAKRTRNLIFTPATATNQWQFPEWAATPTAAGSTDRRAIKVMMTENFFGPAIRPFRDHAHYFCSDFRYGGTSKLSTSSRRFPDCTFRRVYALILMQVALDEHY